MMEMRRRSTDWQSTEISCHELMAAIITDSLPLDFESETPDERRRVPPYVYVTGPVCIPDGMKFTKPVDIRDVVFDEGIYTDNESFLEMALLPKRVEIHPFAFRHNFKAA